MYILDTTEKLINENGIADFSVFSAKAMQYVFTILIF